MKKAFLVVLMLSSSLIFAQNSISGSVSDADNNPIPGATIVVEGTNTGVWCHQLHDLKDRTNYTDWSDYVGDEVID